MKTYHNIISEILEKIGEKYFLTYEELNKLIPEDIFDSEFIDELFIQLEKNGIFLEDDKRIKEPLLIKKDYHRSKDEFIDNFIDNPAKFYFYELRKNINNKNDEYIKKLLKLRNDIKCILIKTRFFIRSILKDFYKIEKNKLKEEDILYLDNIKDKNKYFENKKNKIKLFYKQIIKEKNNKKREKLYADLFRYLEKVEFNFNYFEKLINDLRFYINLIRGINNKIELIKDKYSINDKNFNIILEDIKNNNGRELSKIEKEIYLCIKERKKFDLFLYENDLTEKELYEIYNKLERLIYRYNTFVNEIITSLLPLVIKIAKYYILKGAPESDLIQEGNLAIVDGIERYLKKEHKKSFSEYITWWIRKSMEELVARNKSALKISKSLSNDIKTFLKSANALKGELLRNPSIDEISDRLNWSKDKTLAILQYIKSPFSLEGKLNDGSDTTLLNIVEDINNKSPDEVVLENIVKEEISKILNNLSEREKNIIKLLYGIGYERAYNYQEVAINFDLSEEEVMELEKKALKKLKEIGEKNNLQELI